MLRGAVFSWTQCTVIFLLYGLFIIQQKCLILYATMLWQSVIFGRLFVKRLALCYQTMVLSCLSATLVYCGQMVGWIKMKLGMKVGRPWHRPHCGRWGPSYPLPPKRAQPPHFSTHVCCGQTVAHLSYWWALVFETEFGLVKVVISLYKRSAVAEVGDRLATIDMGQKVGGCCAPFCGERLGPHLTHCGLGRGLRPCQFSSWSIQPFGHNTPTLQSDRQTLDR